MDKTSIWTKNNLNEPVLLDTFKDTLTLNLELSHEKYHPLDVIDEDYDPEDDDYEYDKYDCEDYDD